MAAVIEEVINVKFQLPVNVQIVAEIIFAQINGRRNVHMIIPEIDQWDDFFESQLIGPVKCLIDGFVAG